MLMKIAFYQELDKSSLFIHILNNTQMKVTLTEIREGRFRHHPPMPASWHIHTEYEVYIQGGDLGGTLKTFYSKECAQAYLEYLQDRKNDYHKVIKEIEI